MLDGAGNAAGDVEISLEFLTGHTHIPVQGDILQGLGHRTGGADRSTSGLGQGLHQLHILLLADTLTGRHHPLSLADGGIHGDAHGKVVAVLLQMLHQSGHLLGGAALLQQDLLTYAGDGRRLFRPAGRAALALGGLAHDGGGDDHPLDLVGALVNGGNLGVPVHPLHVHALEEAGTAEDLHRVVGHLQRDVGGVHLGHGRLGAVGLVVLLELSGGIHQHPGTAQLGGHVSQLEADGLIEADGLAELDTLLGVVHRGLIGPLGNAQRLSRDADTAAVQGGHGDLEALALLAQQILLGDLHVVEDQLGGGRGADAHLVVVIAEGEALPPLFHDEGGDTTGADVRGGHREDHIGVGLGRVGDEDLAAVEEPVITLVQSSGLGAAGIGTGIGLGKTEGAQLLALRQGDQVLLLLLLGTVGEDGPRAQRHVGRQNDAGTAIHPGELLHRDGIAQGIQTRASVLLGIGNTHQTQLSQFPNGLIGELIFLVHQKGLGFDLRLGKGTDFGPQGLVLLRGLEQHGDSSLCPIYW